MSPPSDPLRDDRHLDDEALSAVLDGESTPEEAAHGRSCERCASRIDRFRVVAAAVAAAVPPMPTGLADRLIADALGAEEPAAPVVAIDRARTRSRRGLPTWLAAAAVVAVLAISLPLLARLGTGSSSDEAGVKGDGATEAEAEDGSARDEAALESAATTTSPPRPVDAGDLGDLSSVPAVRAAVQRGLGGADDPAGGQAETDAVEDEETEETEETEEEAASPAPASAPPSDVSGDDCQGTVEADYPGGLGALRLTATGQAGGEPALVYAYADARPGAAPGQLSVFVVAAADCRLLDFLSLTP